MLAPNIRAFRAPTKHFAFVLSLLALGCNSSGGGSVEGLWVSDGYGLFLEVGNGEVRVNEVTAVSCIAWDDPLTLVAEQPDGSWRLKVGGDPSAAYLRPDAESVARLERTGTASDILFHRVGVPPAVCSMSVENNPTATFDVFWTTFQEHYPFFEMKGVDWNGVRESIGSQISENTSPEELFGLFSDAIAPLEDVHTSLTADSLGRASFMRPDPELDNATSLSGAIVEVERRFARALEIVESNYLGGELHSFCNGHLRYGELPGGTAYLYLDQEGDYTDEPGFDATLQVFEAALDTVFSRAGSANALILDVRKNYGGSDILSLALASRLTTTDYLAYAKVARRDPDDPTLFTPPQERMVPTTSRPGFHGPVAQLIGRYTISAGETLTQALMGREPHITRIGEHTQGVFSDVLGRILPNGWQLAIPNELFLTEDGSSFDGPGIPPDIEVPVFRNVDLVAGVDPALERAVAHLTDTGR